MLHRVLWQKVVFGRRESYIENEGTGQRIPMERRKGVFVIWLGAQACWKHVTLSEMTEAKSSFSRLARGSMQKSFVIAARPN